MTPELIVVAALRWVEYTGLLGFIGAVVLRRLAANPPTVDWARVRLDFALALALGGGVGSVAVQSLSSGPPSGLAVLRIAAEAAALVLCRTVGRWSVPMGLAAVLLLPLAGHAARVQPAPPALFVDVLHFLAAGMWAGGIVVVALLRPPGGWRSLEGQALLSRFGRVAAVAFAITALTGLLRASEQLTSVSDLWSTAYGAVLAAKSAGVVAMLALSAVAWRRGVPLARPEAAVALAVAAASAGLAALPALPVAA